MNQKLKQAVYPSIKVTGFSEVDGTVMFYNFINSCLRDGSVVLDFGAGRGGAADDGNDWRRRLAATSFCAVKRIAVDVDPAVKENPFATEHHVMPIENGRVRIPLSDESVDLIICDWVVEHLPAPAEVLVEFKRVLRSGGTVAIRTSNQWHYAYLVARLLGESRLGMRVLKQAQPGRKEADVFPKLYRLNSRRALRDAFAKVGFSPTAVFTWDSEPAYAGNSCLGGMIGFILHRLALLGLLPRACLFGFGVKP